MSETPEAAVVLGLAGHRKAGKSTFSAAAAEQEPKSAVFNSGEVVAEVANAWRQAVDLDVVDDIPQRLRLNQFIEDWLLELPGPVKDITGKTASFEQLKIDQEVIGAGLATQLYQYIDALRGNPGLRHGPITPNNKQEHVKLLQWLGGYLVRRLDEGVWYDVVDEHARIALQEGKKLVVIDGLRFKYDEFVVRRLGGYITRLVRPSIGSDGAVTERSDVEIKADIEVHVDGTIPALGRLAKQLLGDIRSCSVGRRYWQPAVYKASDYAK